MVNERGLELGLKRTKSSFYRREIQEWALRNTEIIFLSLFSVVLPRAVLCGQYILLLMKTLMDVLIYFPLFKKKKFRSLHNRFYNTGFFTNIPL